MLSNFTHQKKTFDGGVTLSTFSDLYFDCSPQYSCALVPEIVFLNPYHETSTIAI